MCLILVPFRSDAFSDLLVLAGQPNDGRDLDAFSSLVQERAAGPISFALRSTSQRYRFINSLSNLSEGLA